MSVPRAPRPRPGVAAVPSLLALLLACAGCRATPLREAGAIEWRTIGHSVEGRPIRCALFDRGGPSVLLLAGIHGDEAAGGPLLERLALELAAAPQWSAGRRVALVPELNPDGLARGTRHNARGVDLNRNFPAANWRPGAPRGAAPLSEPEAQALHALLHSERPVHVLSFHQAAELIDYDGPGEELAHALALVSDLPVQRMGARAGSLGSYAGVDLGIPVLTIELPRSADHMDADALWAAYGPLLVEAIGSESGRGGHDSMRSGRCAPRGHRNVARSP